MSHQDGRCASSAETIVVTSTSANLPGSAVPSGIRLVVIRGSVSGAMGWSLSGTPQVTIVGQTTGTLTGNATAPTLHITGGDVYVRSLVVTGGSPGITADGGAILRLDHVSISNNVAGGILLDGAGFDIKNVTVSSNGPNTSDSAVFGGVRIQGSIGTPKSISLSTVSQNEQIGITCDAAAAVSPAPTGVLASGNTGGDIASACGFSSCASASTTCGAQP